MSVKRSMRAACFGRCSQIIVPGTRVRITLKGPRFSGGRDGLGSQVSIWLGPPAIHSRMTALRDFAFPVARLCSSWGRPMPARPARPALRKLRRPSTTSPSRTVPSHEPNACVCPAIAAALGPSCVEDPTAGRRGLQAIAWKSRRSELLDEGLEVVALAQGVQVGVYLQVRGVGGNLEDAGLVRLVQP